MKERILSEVLKLLLWIAALLALPVLIIGSYPFDPVNVNNDWAIYFFEADLILIVAVVALFLFKMIRRNDPVSP
jgi:cation transport ATPase